MNGNRVRRGAVVLAFLGAALGLSAGQASADMSSAQAAEVQERIDTQLRMAPGGTQTAWNEISWNNGEAVMTFGVGPAALVCAANRFCFFDGLNFRPNRLTLTTARCHGAPDNDLHNYGWGNRAQSWSNNTSLNWSVMNHRFPGSERLFTAPSYSQANMQADDRRKADWFDC